jgi:hypothetical protein
VKTSKRHPCMADSPIRNDILRAPLNSEYKHLHPKLEQVDLKLAEITYQADQRINHVYFPETAVVAMMPTVEDGATVEVGIIGREAIVGSIFYWAAS